MKRAEANKVLFDPILEAQRASKKAVEESYDTRVATEERTAREAAEMPK